MGQHTWFVKDKELYLKQNELYDKLMVHTPMMSYYQERNASNG